MNWSDEQVREHVQHLEGLLGRLDDGPATVAVQALAELYGEALARVMRIAAEAGVVTALTGDELVNHLLLLHGLHPESAQERVRQALNDLRARLVEHQAQVDLIAVDDATVRVRLDVTGCGSTRKTLTTAVEDAVRRAAPEMERIEIQPSPAEPVLIPLDALRGKP
jgi:Fe-S cluster biogenesis protein NfuA